MHSNQKQIRNIFYADFSTVATVTLESVVHISISHKILSTKERFGDYDRRRVSPQYVKEAVGKFECQFSERYDETK